MAFVLNHFTLPPGGKFYYVQPETNARLEGHSYKAWMDVIEKHRKANGLLLEVGWMFNVEQWLCRDLKNKGINWCQVKGLGDGVAWALRPVASLSDQYLGTKLHECKSCQKRQDQLNDW